MFTAICKQNTPRKPKIYTAKTIDTRSHAFNVGIAIDYSPDMAIWLGHLAYWAEKNLAHKKHIHDGLVWCYDTLDTLCEYFPYYSRRQIETIIANSVKEGLVKQGNYNHTSYDRTNWYALLPKAYIYFQHLLTKKNKNLLFASISQICEMEITDLWNGFHRSVMTIPDTDPNPDPESVGDSSNPNTHTDNSPKKPKKELVESNTLHDEEVKKLFEEKFGDYNLTIEQLFMACQEHYEQKSLWVTKDKFVKWIKKEKLDIYTKKGSRLPSKIPKSPEQIKKEQLNKNYNLYYSQFINDRDVLKISDTQNKEPLSFKQWESLQDNIIPLVANQ